LLQYFPTLLFFPAEHGAKPVPVDVDINDGINPLVEFIKTHAKKSFELPNMELLLKEEAEESASAADEEDEDEDLFGEVEQATEDTINYAGVDGSLGGTPGDEIKNVPGAEHHEEL